ncbi:MAG: bifunctional 5,10-methylenetetrahydrofolate dehydrogenase/5,10-methenyltetrahydrofolate cyclohydrolase [Planctomycetota bacterium]
MTAEIIDGNAMAETIKTDLKTRVAALKAHGIVVRLAAVQVGEQPASRVYVNNQRKTCEEIGAEYRLDELPEGTAEPAFVAHVARLNADPAITGIILQQPFPKGWDEKTIQSMIAPAKDVEGMSPGNQGWVMYDRQDTPAPCTARAAVEIVKRSGAVLRGADVCIIGRSEIVGKPAALMLIALHATVSVLNSKTRDLAERCRRADILVVAAGRPNLVGADMIKPGALVVDVGINRVPVLGVDGQPVLNEKGKPKMKTVGDVDFEAVRAVAGKLTPVPGGVGPMTVAILLENVVKAAELSRA